LREELVPGRIGNVNTVVYQLAARQFSGRSPVPYFREGIEGFNGYYRTTRRGYNLVLGNGTVYGRNFIDIPALPAAGEPGSSSNP
jgi:hypothetical protein